MGYVPRGSFTDRFQNFKYNKRWRGTADSATTTYYENKRLTSSELTTTASLTTLATSGALVGGAVAAAGLNGAAATYASVSSLAAAYIFGACTATWQAVVTGGAILILGILAAGVIDFCTRAIHNHYNFGDSRCRTDCSRLSNLGSFADGCMALGSKGDDTVRSLILTPFYLLGHAILWLGYIGALIKNFIAGNKEGCMNASLNLSENSREVCLNLAGIILFPAFDALDFGFGLLSGLGRMGRAGIGLATCGMFCRPNSSKIASDDGLYNSYDYNFRGYT